MRSLFIGLLALGAVACSGADNAPETLSLSDVLDAQPEEVKARYQDRHPQETLEFFGVTPGMTVVDTLADEYWYAGILARYLGPAGSVIAADYSMDMWALFGGFVDEAFLAARQNWGDNLIQQVEAQNIENSASLSSFNFGSVPSELEANVDVVLMVRAIQHFNRFEDNGGHFTTALEDSFSILKPGGVLGVVQHRAPEGNADEWANGDNGYVKQSHVIEMAERAGFILAGSSEINANPKDQPTENDLVWRLPPSLATSEDNPALREAMQAIGESDRMTLKFLKPE